MTTGTKNLSVLSTIELATRLTETGQVISTYSGTVGIYDVKTWSGIDAPTVSTPKTYENFWVLRKAVRAPKGYPQQHYIQVRRLARPPKSVRKGEKGEHPYSMNHTMWFDRTYKYINNVWDPETLSWVPYTLREATFRMNYGDGFSIQNMAWTANDQLRLVNKLAKRTLGSDFHAGVTLGESREAAKMIWHAALRLRQALVAFSRGRVSDAATALGFKGQVSNFDQRVRQRSVTDKELASRWLELQYGWLPLISDVQAGAEALAEHHAHPRVLRLKARTYEAWEFQTVSEINLPRSQVEMKGGKYGQYVAIFTEIDLPALTGLTDLKTVAWELTPWSHVVDWAIPISSYLKALNYSSSVSGTFIRTVTKRVMFSNAGLGIVRADNTTAVELPEFWYNQVSVDRTVSSSLAVPLPQLVPLGRVISGLTRAGNAVAHLVQLRR